MAEHERQAMLAEDADPNARPGCPCCGSRAASGKPICAGCGVVPDPSGTADALATRRCPRCKGTDAGWMPGPGYLWHGNCWPADPGRQLRRLSMAEEIFEGEELGAA